MLLTCVCAPRSYIRFSAICAGAVRAALKPQFKTEALRVAESNVKVLKPKAATSCKFLHSRLEQVHPLIFDWTGRACCGDRRTRVVVLSVVAPKNVYLLHS